VATLPAGTTAADSAPSTGAGSVPWLRSGAAADVPSLALAQVELSVERAVVATGTTIAGVIVTAALDATHGAGAVGLELRGGGRAVGSSPEPWLADVPDLALDLRYGPARGELEIDTCRVVVAAAGPAGWEMRWREAEPAQLEMTGTARIDEAGVAADLRGDLAAPLAALLAPILAPVAAESWPPTLPREDYARINVDFTVDATVARPGGVRGVMALDLGGSPGWGRSRLVLDGSFDPERPETADVRLDTLSVMLPGLAVAGSGALQGEAYRVTLWADAVSPVPLLALAGTEAASLDLAADFTLECAGRGLPTAATADGIRVRLRGGGRVAAGDSAWLVDVPDLAVDLGYDPARHEIAVDTCRVQVAAAGPRAWTERWPDAAPAELEVTGTVRLDTAAIDLDVCGAVRAPFVTLAADRWPEELPRDDYAALDADFTVTATGRRPGGVTGRLAVAVGGSPGWGRSRLTVVGTYDPELTAATNLRLDTLQVTLPGLTVAGTGSLRGEKYAADVRADVATPLPLLVLAGSELADAELTATLAVAATGIGSEPEGRLELDVDARAGSLEVRRLRLEAERGGGAATVRLDAGRVAVGDVVWADSLAAVVRHAAARELPFGLELTAHREAGLVALDVAADLDTVITVRLESLRLLVAGQEIGLVAPATVRLDTLNHTVALDSFALAGAPGTLALSGAFTPDEVRLDLAADLLLAQEMLQELVPSSFWSEDGGPRADPEFTGDLAATLRHRRDRPDLGMRLGFGLATGDTSGLAATFAVTSDDTVLLHGRAVLPGRYDGGGGWRVEDGESLLLDLPEQSLPLRRFAPLIPGELQAAGTVTVGAQLSIPPGRPDEERPGELMGMLRTDRMRLVGPNRSRAEVEVDCRLAGTALDPRLEGTITIPSAFSTPRASRDPCRARPTRTGARRSSRRNRRRSCRIWGCGSSCRATCASTATASTPN